MSPDPSAALATADALARAFVARAAPIRFGVARAPAEVDAVYRLRYRTVVQQGWARPEAFPDGRERDAHDARALHIVGWDGPVLAAATRLVLPAAGVLLPTEEAFQLAIEPHGQVVDVGRTCVAPGYSDRQHRVLWGLFGEMWLAARERGFSTICGVFTASVIRLYRRSGYHMEVLGAPRLYWGEERFPVLIQPAASVELIQGAAERCEIRPQWQDPLVASQGMNDG